MKLLCSLLMLAAVSASAQMTNLTFMWDSSPNATGYRLYEIQGTNRTLLGTTSNLTFVVSNWNVTASKTVSITSTNLLGESELSEPLAIPPAPSPVKNLKPVPLCIVSPIPGVIEFSQDLVDWTQRVRLYTDSNSASVKLTWVQHPNEPMMFMRTRSLSPSSMPPLPTTLRPP